MPANETKSPPSPITIASRSRNAVELGVDAHRVQRRALVGELLRLAGALLVLDRAQLARPMPPVASSSPSLPSRSASSVARDAAV